MKRIFSILIGSLLLLTACDNSSKEEKARTDSLAKETERKRVAEEGKEKVAEDLQKLTPLTEDELKTKFPETLMDATLSNYSFSDNMGASIGHAEYTINDSSSVMLTISDCAGPGGAGLYNLQFGGQLEYNTDNDNEYTKVIDFSGGKAIEFCKKKTVECSFLYFSGGRYLVMLEGNNVNAGELKKLAAGLKVR